MSLKPRKIIKGIFVMLGMAAVFMGILVAGFIYVTEYKIHVISDSFSADRTYRLEIDQVGDPAWPYGSTDCRLVLYSKEDEKIREKDFSVANDGKNVSENSFSIRWEEEQVIVTVYGEEQGYIEYTLQY